MGIAVSAIIDIARIPEDVARYMFDPRNDPTWIGGIKSAEMLTGGAPGKGMTVRRVAKFLGKTINYVLEVVEFSRWRMVMHSIEAPFPMHVTYEINSRDDGSHVSILVEGEPRGFYGIANAFMPPLVKRNLSADLRRLRDEIEFRPR